MRHMVLLDKPEEYLDFVFLEYKVTSSVMHAFYIQDQRQMDLVRQPCYSMKTPLQVNIPSFHTIFPGKRHGATQAYNLISDCISSHRKKNNVTET